MIDCIFEYWNVLEADFQREYRINLIDAARNESLSWRRFIALVTSLSGQSVFAYLYSKDKPQNKPERKYIEMPSDPEQARDVIRRMMSK